MTAIRIGLLAGAAIAALGAPAYAGPVPTPTPSGSATVPAPDPSAEPEPRYERKHVQVSISPDSGSFGVGQLITAEFSAPVRFRAKAEEGMQVSADGLPVKGSWAWMDKSTAIYRPRTFWPGKARIAVKLDLHRVRLNQDDTTVWLGGADATRKESFRTGRSFIARIDAKDDQMRIYREGMLVKVFGVSLGKSGFRTRAGIKIITGEKYRWQRMTSDELGLVNESYDLQVPYAVRLTPSGEFVHGAPWAASRIGVYNGSHGCTNLNLGDARWFYNHVRAGDVTVTTRTGRRMETWNGTPGAYWNYPWKQWREMSALH